METTKITAYIAEHNLAGTKLGDVLRDYDLGHCGLGDICYFYGYPIDRAIYHLSQLDTQVKP